MKKIFGILGVLLAVSCAGCAGTGPKKLSNEYVTVENYQGVEIEKAEVSEVKEEDIDKVVAHMMAGYIRLSMVFRKIRRLRMRSCGTQCLTQQKR